MVGLHLLHGTALGVFGPRAYLSGTTEVGTDTTVRSTPAIPSTHNDTTTLHLRFSYEALQ